MSDLKRSPGFTRRRSAAALLLACASSALAATRYVDVNSTNAMPPYTDWTTAATKIQDAVDAAMVGDEVVVTNGVYDSGGRTVGYTINVVALDKPLRVRSVNGPESTSINGGGDFVESRRCVYLTNGASLSGFTLAYGICDERGGGALGEGHDCTLDNCLLTGNWASGAGGGAYGCTLNRCTLTGNVAGVDFYGIGHPPSETYGGGADHCALNNCILTGNSAEAYAQFVGGAFGGAAYSCTLQNCIVTGNSAIFRNSTGGGEEYGGGTYFCAMNNCIVYFNNNGANYDPTCTLNYCCTTPLSGGTGNITNTPLFADTNGWADLRLQPNSPCINAGNNAYAPAGPDLDGNPRIVGGIVDIGAYEYQSLSLLNFGVVSNQAGFNITGQSNQVVIVEASGDQVNWSPLATNTLSGHPLLFSDPTPASLPRRFYRTQAQYH